MNFCNHCGSDKLEIRIPEGDHLPRHVCSKCGTIHYHNPKLIVGCLIEDAQGKIMLCRRGIEPRKGLWNLPCGYMENDETVEEGALREVKEETGADAVLGELLVVYSVPQASQVYLIFSAVLAQGTSWHLTLESTEIEFFEKDQIPWEEIAFTSNTFALKAHLNPEKGKKLAIGQLKF